MVQAHQNFLQQMKPKMPDNSDNDTQYSNTSTPGAKARRKATMFIKKAFKHDSDSQKEDAMKMLKEENRKLKQQLQAANSRIRQLEFFNRAQSERLSDYAKPTPIQVPDVQYSAEGTEYRDDDDGSKDPADAFSVEVAALTRGSKVQGEFLDIENEIHSTAPSAKTIPTGNDKKSKQQRRQHEMRHKLRRSNSSGSSGSRSFHGEDAYLDYFSRRSSPALESITEIETIPSYFEDYEFASTTSELTASVASSTMGDEESTDSGSLMLGKRLPLQAMKSLLRISSEKSEKSDTITFASIDDDSEVLFGEI